MIFNFENYCLAVAIVSNSVKNIVQAAEIWR